MENFYDELSYETSTKSDGNLSFTYGERNEVLENRKKFLSKFGLRLDDTVVMSLHHGENIEIVDERNRGKDSSPADTLVTQEPDLVLFLLTADCLPIVYYDPDNKVVALGHLGWRGTEAKLSQKVVHFLHKEFGSNPSKLIISIGPGIHKESYRFDALGQKEAPGWEPYLTDLPDGNIAVDIVGYNLKQLIESGVPKKNISVSDVDTCKSQNFFSHYRAKRTGEKEGRFATIVTLKS